MPCVISFFFFSPFSITITSLGEDRANLGAFRMFDLRFRFCLLPLPLRVWDGLRLVIVDLPGIFFYFFETVYLHILRHQFTTFIRTYLYS